MAGLYSVRFAMGFNAIQDYTVPPGKRAIVKCVTAYNGNASGRAVGVHIGVVPVFDQLIGPTQGVTIPNLHIVVNSGETLRLVLSASMSGQVSGYLLNEVSA